MFGRKKQDDKGTAPEGNQAKPLPLKSKPRANPVIPPHQPSSLSRSEPGRPAFEIARPSGRRSSESDHGFNDGKKLTVGREITLTGEISACERLVVEGKVEAELTDCREIEITETGTFKGEAEIEYADISGRFEGSIMARDLLIVRATGRITGKVRYGRLEIERGGEITGEIIAAPPKVEPARPMAPTAVPAPPAQAKTSQG